MRAGLASAIHSHAVWRGITVGHVVWRRLLNAWRSFVVGANIISGRPEAVRPQRLLRDNHQVAQERCDGAVELPGVPLDLHAPLGHSKQKLRRFSGARGGWLLSSTNSVFTSVLTRQRLTPARWSQTAAHTSRKGQSISPHPLLVLLTQGQSPFSRAAGRS